MKQQHNIQLEFDGNKEDVKPNLQFLLNQLGPIGVEALVDAYKNSKMIQNEVKKRVKKYEKKKVNSQKKPSAFDKLPS